MIELYKYDRDTMEFTPYPDKSVIFLVLFLIVSCMLLLSVISHSIIMKKVSCKADRDSMELVSYAELVKLKDRRIVELETVEMKKEEKLNIEHTLGFKIPKGYYDFVMYEMPHPMDIKGTMYAYCYDWRLLTFEIMFRESSFNPNAVSNQGYKGLMQLGDSERARYMGKFYHIAQEYTPEQMDIIIGICYADDLMIEHRSFEKGLNWYNSGTVNKGFGKEICKKLNFKN